MNLLLEGASIAIWIVVAVVAFVLILLLAFVPINLWFRCLVSGTYVNMFKLVGMRLRQCKKSRS